MIRSTHVALLCLALACGSIACAPKLIGPTSPSGVFFSLRLLESHIFLLSSESGLELPLVAEVIVHVQNAQGHPVDGISVEFQVEPAWRQSASLMPQHTITHGGIARAVLEPSSIGVVRVTARVENSTQKVAIVVSPAPSGGGAAESE